MEAKRHRFLVAGVTGFAGPEWEPMVYQLRQGSVDFGPDDFCPDALEGEIRRQTGTTDRQADGKVRYPVNGERAMGFMMRSS